MAIEILMPALSPTMEEGTLAKWLVAEGDTVSSGDVMAEIETDKATMEFEAVDEGVIGKILIAEGTEGVKVNTAIALLLEDGESADDVAATPAKVEEAAKPADAAPAPAAAPAAPQTDVSPDWPEGTTMKQQTVREALRDGMAEEMRSDETVFIMGEEVAEYQGAYKITQGMLDEFGSKRVIDITSSTLRPRRFTCPAVRWARLWCSVAPMVLRHALALSTRKITPPGSCRCRASRS